MGLGLKSCDSAESYGTQIPTPKSTLNPSPELMFDPITYHSRILDSKTPLPNLQSPSPLKTTTPQISGEREREANKKKEKMSSIPGTGPQQLSHHRHQPLLHHPLQATIAIDFIYLCHCHSQQSLHLLRRAIDLHRDHIKGPFSPFVVHR